MRIKQATTLLRRVGGRTAVLLALGATVLSGSIARAEEPSSSFGFQAYTVASSIRVTYSIPGYVVSTPVDGGGPVAQATLDVFAGRAFASLPYPGDDGANYPQLVNVATGKTPPGYPFYAVASEDSPKSELSDPSGSYALKATSSPAEARGEARFRPGGGDKVMSGAAATTSVTRNGDEVVATAESLTEGISVADLSVASVHSKSVTVYRPGARPASTTEMHVDGGRVGDRSFAFGPDGLQVAQQGVPVPAGQGMASLNQALAPAGLAVRFSEPSKLNGGAEAPVFAIQSIHPLPAPGASQGILTIRFGQALSGVAAGEQFAAGAEGDKGGSAASPAPGGSTPPSEPGGPGAASPSPSPAATDDGRPPSPTAADVSTAPVGSDTTGGSDAGFTALAPLSPTPEPVVGAVEVGSSMALPEGFSPAATAALRPARAATARIPVPAGTSTSSLYGAVAMAGLAFAGISSFWRKGGRTWTS